MGWVVPLGTKGCVEMWVTVHLRASVGIGPPAYGCDVLPVLPRILGCLGRIFGVDLKTHGRATYPDQGIYDVFIFELHFFMCFSSGLWLDLWLDLG